MIDDAFGLVLYAHADFLKQDTDILLKSFASQATMKMPPVIQLKK